MDIDKLEAGPEIDMLIAKHIMGGLRVIPFCDAPFKDDWMADGTWMRRIKMPDSEGEWQPSTDWAAAGEVIEKLHSPDASIKLETGIRNGVSVWWCVFIIGDDRHKYAAADTPQLAICRAALKAVED